MTLGTNIHFHQMMWGEKESQFIYIYMFCRIINMKTVSAQQVKNCQRYSHETGYKNKLVSDNVQRTRTVTPPTSFMKLCPFEIFLMNILFVLYHQGYFHETWYKYKAASDNV